MSHAEHHMHENSLLARASLNLNEREAAVLMIFPSVKWTDREAAEALNWELTSTRPRISDLVRRGLLAEVGHVKEIGCRTRVRLCAITKAGLAVLAERERVAP